MKNYLDFVSLFVLLLVVFITQNTFASKDFENAEAYMTYINDQYEDITKETWRFTRAVAKDHDKQRIKNKRKTLIENYNQALKNVAAMPSYEKDIAFRDTVLRYLKRYKSVLKQDYAEILRLKKTASASYDNMQAYCLAREKAGKKILDAYTSLSKEQQRFANEYDLEMEKDMERRAKKLRENLNAYRYYNTIYLVFFSAHNQEELFLEAMKKGDAETMEHSKKRLKKYAVNGLDTLAQIGSYEGDPSLVKACRKMLTFYKKEANQTTDLINFYRTRENFEKIKQNYESKKEQNRTQKDIDKYNRALQKYNQAVKQYNKTHKTLSKKRNEKYKAWNKTTDTFKSDYMHNKFIEVKFDK